MVSHSIGKHIKRQFDVCSAFSEQQEHSKSKEIGVAGVDPAVYSTPSRFRAVDSSDFFLREESS